VLVCEVEVDVEDVKEAAGLWELLDDEEVLVDVVVPTVVVVADPGVPGAPGVVV
jgi:hypothetical protein